jgi:hypothetical protein
MKGLLWSLTIPRRGGYGNTSGSGHCAKDVEGAVNPYAATVTFDNTLQGRITP